MQIGMGAQVAGQRAGGVLQRGPVFGRERDEARGRIARSARAAAAPRE